MGNIHTCGPNECVVISGGCFGSEGKKMVTGSWAWAWWLVTDVQKMSLEVMTLNPMCDNVETKQGVPLTVTGVAQVKIMKDDKFLGIAAEQFLGKKEDEIVETILQTLEGHLRAILGTLTVEEVYKDRDQFANLVRSTRTGTSLPTWSGTLPSPTWARWASRSSPSPSRMSMTMLTISPRLENLKQQQ